ncbi:unnamed protein product [Sphenostylis stenocarpa]|uniref:F-box associated beta-propeller type 1 domain-containing protein n=1 Tax=Sphenostylis stenocarpa TaxID=92480 RepID=A0AA86T0F2_9FABA|nr:unnamed protein product [Sphenostylis stenocarpa]
MASPPSSPSSPPSSPPSPPPPPTPLPMDLQFEILSYLPCRSVVRFLVLSHAHFSYINSRDFITEHHERSPKYVLLLPSLDASLHNDDASLSLSTELRFPFLERANNEILCIIGECDGILCIETYRGIFFVNPAILRFFLVGPTQPQNNPHVHCYGFIRKGFDYILLHIEVDKQHHRRRGGPQSPRAWVYSFQQRSWRHVETPICTLCLSMCYPRSAVAYEGFLHWGAKRWVESSWHYFILTFCPHNEICGELLLPDRLAVPSTNDNKGVFLVGSGSNKPLTAYSLNYAETHHFTSVWTMDRYGDRDHVGIVSNNNKLVDGILNSCQDKVIALVIVTKILAQNISSNLQVLNGKTKKTKILNLRIGIQFLTLFDFL